MSDITAERELSRIRWQCRRGMLELDLLLDNFAVNCYAQLTEQERKTFMQVMNYPDQELFDFFFSARQPIDKDVAHVIERIRRAAAT